MMRIIQYYTNPYPIQFNHIQLTTKIFSKSSVCLMYVGTVHFGVSLCYPQVLLSKMMNRFPCFLIDLELENSVNPNPSTTSDVINVSSQPPVFHHPHRSKRQALIPFPRTGKRSAPWSNNPWGSGKSMFWSLNLMKSCVHLSKQQYRRRWHLILGLQKGTFRPKPSLQILPLRCPFLFIH